MQLFRVIEEKNGKQEIVYVQPRYINVYQGIKDKRMRKIIQGATKKHENICHSVGQDTYEQYSNYFNQLMDIVARYIQNFKFELNVCEESTMISLLIPRNNEKQAEKVAEILKEKLKNDIENIGVKRVKEGVILNIIDFFYCYNE